MVLTRIFKILAIVSITAALLNCAGENVGKRGVVDGPRIPIAEKPKDSKTVDEADRLEKIKEGASEPAPDQPTEIYTPFARCTGWPMSEGKGVLEFNWNAKVPEDRVVLVRLENSESGELVQSFAVMTPITGEENKANSILIEQKPDSESGLQGFSFELKMGKSLKTIFVLGSGESAELICSFIE